MPACYALPVTCLLVSGASGAGKSSVRALVAPALARREVADRVLAWAERAIS
jgi:adenylylsulfate kinase-like enzyme